MSEMEEKKCQKLQDIENTNGLEEHLSECTNNKVGRIHIRFNHVPIAKTHLLTVATMRRTCL